MGFRVASNPHILDEMFLQDHEIGKPRSIAYWLLVDFRISKCESFAASFEPYLR